MDDDSLNSYFYDVVYYCLEWDQKEYVDNFKIYEHRLNWVSHAIFRSGYLFFGTPESRPTAQPPEDYYIYFIPPYGNCLLYTSKDLCKAAGISSSSIVKLSKNENVTTGVLVKICKALNCDIGDIMEIVDGPDEQRDCR